MCVIGSGETGVLLKGGLVRLLNGDVYLLSDCTLKGGGTLVLAVGQVQAPQAPKKVRGKEKLKGVSLLDDTLSFSFIPSLPPPQVRLISEAHEPPPAPPTAEVPYTPFALLGGALLFAFKKLAGLDRQLKSGSCEIRHREAIVRIAKLEGKVLRKQVVDGVKTAKGLKEKLEEKKEGQDEAKPL